MDLNEFSAEGLGGTGAPMSEDNNESLTTPNDSEENLSNTSKYEIHPGKTASVSEHAINIHSFDPNQKRKFHMLTHSRLLCNSPSNHYTLSVRSSEAAKRDVCCYGVYGWILY